VVALSTPAQGMAAGSSPGLPLNSGAGGVVGRRCSLLVCYVLNSCVAEEVGDVEGLGQGVQDMAANLAAQALVLVGGARGGEMGDQPLDLWVRARAANLAWPGACKTK
jgi:hypothetical protein